MNTLSFIIIFQLNHIQNTMIINSSTYAAGKQKNQNREFLKKKKSNQAFYMKAKINSQLGEQLKYIQSRKSQARLSTSLIEINSRQDSKRVNSIEIVSNQLSNLDNIVPTKPSLGKQKKNIGHCVSERNVNMLNDPDKMHKYRKFSSNAQISEENPNLQSHRRKLSLVDYPNQAEPVRKIEKLGLMAWVILIRKLFADEYKKRKNKTIKLSTLYSYIQKIDKQGLQEFSLVVEPLDYELDLSRSQIITVFESFFAISKKTKIVKSDNIGKATFCEIISCLLQFQSKNTNVTKQNNHKSTSEQEEAIETARFQQGSGNDQAKRRKHSDKKHQLNNLMPKMQTHKYIKQNGKQNIVASVNMAGENLFKSPATCNKSKQSLNPSLSPFMSNDPKSIQQSRVLLQRDQSGPLAFKKRSFQIQGIQGTHEQSLGMLTIQGKSPRELMVSEIYQSIQRQGFVHQNNVSFSLEHLDVQTHVSFERTVHSFEEILKKIRNIQNSYKSKSQDIGNNPKQPKSEEVNMFLQQLLNYRIAMSNQSFEEENYSYLVSFDNLTEFKDQDKGIMLALLQSIYLKEYFNALQGIKINNSLPFLKNVSHLIHQGIKMLNISHNNISNMNFILDLLPNQNSLEFLNINNNFFPDISSILKKCNKLKELHCQSNLITQIKQGKCPKQLKIIDLSCNKIQNEQDLIGLVPVSTLIIINICSNPLTKKNWRNDWKGTINLNNIYQMENLYVMSSYGHQKDIAFSNEKVLKSSQKDRNQRSDFIQEFSKNEANRMLSNHREMRTNKNVTPKIQNQLQKLSYRPQDQPKQKISKIKAFIDGKII